MQVNSAWGECELSELCVHLSEGNVLIGDCTAECALSAHGASRRNAAPSLWFCAAA